MSDREEFANMIARLILMIILEHGGEWPDWNGDFLPDFRAFAVLAKELQGVVLRNVAVNVAAA